MLKKIFVDSFDILRKNLIIIQPLILFFLILSFLISPIKYTMQPTVPMIIFMVSVFALSCAFLAGWFQMFQAAIRNYKKDLKEEEKAMMSFAILREFLPAIGGFFIPVAVASVLYVVFLYFVFKLTFILGVNLIGIPESFKINNLLQIFADETRAYEFISALSDSDKLKISQWNFLTLFMTGAYSYVTMFWFPAIIMNAQNAFAALVTGVKAVFERPLITFGIFIFYWILNLIISVISSFAPSNFIFQLFILMFIIFIMNYYVMAVFLYFEDYSADGIDSWTNRFR